MCFPWPSAQLCLCKVPGRGAEPAGSRVAPSLVLLGQPVKLAKLQFSHLKNVDGKNSTHLTGLLGGLKETMISSYEHIVLKKEYITMEDPLQIISMRSLDQVIQK